MLVQIRNPIAVEVDAADDKGSVSFHFFTAAEHQAVVTIGRDLLPDLIEQLEEIIAAEARPQAAKQPALEAEAETQTEMEIETEAEEPAPPPAVQQPVMQKPVMQKPATQPVKAQPIRQPAGRDFALFDRDMPLAKPMTKPLTRPKEPARDHQPAPQPAHQPILRALLQA
jgi:hypothetical protein